MRKAPLLVLAAGVAVFAACSSKKPNPPATPTTTVDAGLEAGLTDASADGTEAGAPDGGATADAGSVSPYGAFLPDGGIAPAPAAALPPEQVDLLIDTAINTTAAKLAPRMTLEGTPGRATLKEGERFNMIVTMQPGRCYTFVAQSAPMQIQQLDLRLMTPPFYNVQAAASNAADKNPAVIGKGAAAQCPVTPIAVPYRLDVVATKGAGRVGVYVFSRSK